ncbi:MAG TPA: hypothetical protein VNT53_04920 [Pseudolysinimonas sp.]|nr:hypothetical protein [Pseudolysinimonas sp.]
MIDLCVAASAASLVCIAGSTARRSPQAWIPAALMTVGMVVASVEGVPASLVLLVAAVNIFIAAPLSVLRSGRSAREVGMQIHRALSAILMGGLLIVRSTSGGLAHSDVPGLGSHHGMASLGAALGVAALCAAGYVVFSGWLAARTARQHRGRAALFTVGDITAMTAAVIAMGVMT